MHIMNVLFLSNSSQIGGGERCLESLFQGLRGTGVRPVVVCPGPGPFVELLGKMGVTVILRDLVSPSLKKPWATARDYFWLSRLISAERIAVIHANGTFGGRKAVLAAKRKRGPLICHVHYPLSADCYRSV